MAIFPNPVSEKPLNISFDLKNAEQVDITLLDAGGTSVQQLFFGRLPAGPQSISAPIKTTFPAGIYWVSVAAGKERSVKAIGVVRRVSYPVHLGTAASISCHTFAKAP